MIAGPLLRQQGTPILVQNLTKRFGEFTAVDSVSFSVPPGEVFGWLGPNGAGKTTTFRMLLGLLKPSSGNAFVLGFNSAQQTKEVHARVGYMHEQFTLYNDLTAKQNICGFMGESRGCSRRTAPASSTKILHMAGLDGREDALTGSLSGGWKQRLALGCAIVHQTKVVFLDEPTAERVRSDQPPAVLGADL